MIKKKIKISVGKSPITINYNIVYTRNFVLNKLFDYNVKQLKITGIIFHLRRESHK